jgi:hypothetical protein
MNPSSHKKMENDEKRLDTFSAVRKPELLLIKEVEKRQLAAVTGLLTAVTGSKEKRQLGAVTGILSGVSGSRVEKNAQLLWMRLLLLRLSSKIGLALESAEEGL